MALSVLSLMLASAILSHELEIPEGCTILGPEKLMPEAVKRVRLGMSKAELQALLGAPGYSPVAGQYYFSTGGECPLWDSGREAPCGLVAVFRIHAQDPESRHDELLESCWWGAIGE